MDSCSVCRNLIPLPGPSGGFIAGGEGIDLANSGSECLTCSILWDGLSAFCVDNPEDVQWMALNQEEGGFRLQYLPSQKDEKWVGLYFYTTDAESPMSDVFKPNRDLEPDTACVRYLSQARGWVRECCEKHDHRGERLGSALPTRVLDVSFDDNLVFLREPSVTEEGFYVALSHVWGEMVPIQTTTKTITFFKDGIRLEALPQTFRDAVYMAKYLECRYLWIDSLCIVQDSKEDWAREAARMAQVYGNAVVTLAAVHSPNSNGGLFSKHDANSVQHVIKRVGENGVEIIVKVRPALEHSAYYASISQGLGPGVSAPLLRRAWCYQEYLLSPRVLLFTEWEILWVCGSQTRCNCGHTSETTRSLVIDSAQRVRFEKDLENGSVTELHSLWRDIVRSFSQKQITFDTDRLAALAGIVSRFSGKGLGCYLEGLWEKTLIVDLFWHTGWPFGIEARRSDDASLPSWSWASVHGPIDMEGSIKIEGIEVIETISDSTMPGSLFNAPARCLTLRGRLVSARVWGLGKNRLWGAALVGNTKQCRWQRDVPDEVECGAEDPVNAYIFCGSQGPGLVLVEILPSSNTYRRLGRIGTVPGDKLRFPVRIIKLY